jgi:hypothetical protein
MIQTKLRRVAGNYAIDRKGENGERDGHQKLIGFCVNWMVQVI